MSFEEEVESYTDFPEVPLFQEARRFSEIGFQRKMHISLIILFIVHAVYIILDYIMHYQSNFIV